VGTVAQWLSWNSGLFLAGRTDERFLTPNVALHLFARARVGLSEGPVGYVLWQPDPDADAELACFVCPDRRLGHRVAALFGDAEIARAPVVAGEVRVVGKLSRHRVAAHVRALHHALELRLTGLDAPRWVERPPTEEAPFAHAAVEVAARRVRLEIDGRPTPLLPADVGALGGGPLVWSPAGMWVRQAPAP